MAASDGAVRAGDQQAAVGIHLDLVGQGGLAEIDSGRPARAEGLIQRAVSGVAGDGEFAGGGLASAGQPGERRADYHDLPGGGVTATPNADPGR